MAPCDEEAAIRILQMPFLSGDHLRLPALIAVLGLARLAETNLDGLQQVLGHSELRGGITREKAALAALMVLEQQNPSAATAIQALPWVDDGITYTAPNNEGSIHRDLSQYEHESVIELVQIAHHSTASVLALTDKSWVQDGITTSVEYTAVSYILYMVNRDGDLTARIVEMPFLDSMTGSELHTVQILEELQSVSPNGLQQLLSSPAISGGITKDHRGTVALLDLKVRDPEAGSAVEALEWVAGGIAPSEQTAVLAMRNVALESVALFRVLLAKPWVRDTLTPDETQAIYTLASIGGGSYSHSDEAAALQTLDMPFMEEVDGLDVAALESLQRLVWVWEADKGYLQEVLSQQSLRNGITDDQTNVVAVLDRVVENRPDLLTILFDTEQTIVKERQITLPLGGEVALSVIWPGLGGSDSRASHTMDLLEHSVRTHEGFMGMPYPKGHAIMLVADVSEFGGGGGPSSIVTVDPSYYDSGLIIAHEAAHTYWSFPPLSIREGAANFLDKISEEGRAGTPLPQLRGSCSLANNISELVSFPPKGGRRSTRLPATISWEKGCSSTSTATSEMRPSGRHSGISTC